MILEGTPTRGTRSKLRESLLLSENVNQTRMMLGRQLKIPSLRRVDVLREYDS